MSSPHSEISKMFSLDSNFSKMSSLDSNFSKLSSLDSNFSDFEHAILESKDHTGEMDDEADTLKWYKKEITAIIYEYLLSNDTYELIYSIENLGFPEYNPTFIKKLITIAMDQKNKGKEMASMLISALTMQIFTTNDVMSGFTMFLRSIDDTMLDIPDASDKLALFFARAVVDDVLAPVHLNVLAAKFPSDNTFTATASKTIEMARKHALSPHAGQKLERCWGGSLDLEENIVNLLQEYQSGGDLQEALLHIRDIGIPLFNHAIVKRALIMVMENDNSDRMLGLLQACHAEYIISESQMIKGFHNVKEELDDLIVDIPKAPKMFDLFVEHAKMNGWLEAGVEN